MSLDVVIDLSHHQSHVDFRTAATAGIVAVIHKATQGTHFVDDRFLPRRELVHSVGMLYGAYHFATGDDVEAQARHFLGKVDPKNELLVLDVEHNPMGSEMTLAQAETFVTIVHRETGRYPVVYGGGDYLRDVLKPSATSVLGRCPLWWARYSRFPPKGLPACWSRWTLWQYTATGAVPGVTGHVDRNRFDGTVDALRVLWP